MIIYISVYPPTLLQPLNSQHTCVCIHTITHMHTIFLTCLKYTINYILIDICTQTLSLSVGVISFMIHDSLLYQFMRKVNVKVVYCRKLF